ncbi:unnamed protein product [Parascedosporium putredinis]|uniref:Uncharacterized protein n=1 Tax=Parascedosporium putredinis TaxID=1442378 RepID=A0A9P1MDS7_9PEZI|nr:unnamed protein product [Parascedosporium putredinis]CAI8001177.1 unnamed protein product [Parascedosporium putredinis]
MYPSPSDSVPGVWFPPTTSHNLPTPNTPGKLAGSTIEVGDGGKIICEETCHKEKPSRTHPPRLHPHRSCPDFGDEALHMSTRVYVETLPGAAPTQIRPQKAEAELAALRAAGDDKFTCRLRQLTEENAALRQNLEAALGQAEKRGRENAKLRDDVVRLERDNDCLRVRVRQLLKDHRHLEPIAYLRRLVRDWKHRFECADRALEERRLTIDEQSDKIAELRDRLAVYERLLRRHNIVIC